MQEQVLKLSSLKLGSLHQIHFNEKVQCSKDNAQNSQMKIWIFDSLIALTAKKSQSQEHGIMYLTQS